MSDVQMLAYSDVTLIAPPPRRDLGWWIVNQRNSAGFTTATIVVWAHNVVAAVEIAALLGVPNGSVIGGPYLDSVVPEGHRSHVLTMEEVYFVLWEG